jgi:hypothetical protein
MAQVPMTVRQVRIPHGFAEQHNGWFTFVRGAPVRRRDALRMLLSPKKSRARIEFVQSDDPKHWVV